MYLAVIHIFVTRQSLKSEPQWVQYCSCLWCWPGCVTVGRLLSLPSFPPKQSLAVPSSLVLQSYECAWLFTAKRHQVTTPPRPISKEKTLGIGGRVLVVLHCTWSHSSPLQFCGYILSYYNQTGSGDFAPGRHRACSPQGCYLTLEYRPGIVLLSISKRTNQEWTVRSGWQGRA